jgi:site-specific DNA recombinase
MSLAARIRCAIYTRKSSEEGLEQSFNSLHAQREACEAFILSQRHEGWQVLSEEYDDGGFSGGSMERPALKKLLQDIAAKKIDTVVVYKVDRLTRSLADFAKIVEQFDKQGISFVSVTQQFNTTTSMGRLTLNVLLSFAQFEREVTGERIRDKIAASKKKGMWMGGVVPVGFRLVDRLLTVDHVEAEHVREIYRLYLKFGCVSKLQAHLASVGVRSKEWLSRTGRVSGGTIYSRGALYDMLHNRIYRGEITHKGQSYPGQHAPIVDQELWDQVQASFEANLQAPRKRPRVTSQSLLTGILFDESGNRFTPSHTNKKGQRYRYYVSQAMIKREGRRRPGPVRYPAEELESLVVGQVRALLQSSQRMMDILCDPTAEPDELQRAVEGKRIWAAASTDKVRDSLRAIVQRVVLGEKQIEVQLSRSCVRHLVLGTKEEEVEGDERNVLILQAASELKRCGGEMRLLLPPDGALDWQRAAPSLVRAIARAHDWVDQILKGEALNQRAIAIRTGLNERYVSRIIPLAFLAPDIVEAVLEGTQPAHLTLDACLRNLPTSWIEQRNVLALGNQNN